MKEKENTVIHPSSFRDRSGYVFTEEDRLLRQVNRVYQEHYDHLMQSGLYEKLVGLKLVVPHQEVNNHPGISAEVYKVLEPEKIAFISYPYEWSFGQLKDAAMVTLRIQKIALDFGMVLKDANAFNIQFHQGAPLLIDTLSFELYQENQPWVAYRQFCEHFLAPLALMSYTDVRLNRLTQLHVDGIPLDLASKLLPFGSKLNTLLLMHIHLHAKAQKRYQHQGENSKKVRIKKSNLFALVQSLKQAVQRLQVKQQDTQWGNYYDFTNYSKAAMEHKRTLIESFLRRTTTRTLWDLGANTGEFTRIASEFGIECIAFDIDPLAIEAYYSSVKVNQVKNVLPLLLDVTNPTPAIGWNNEERTSLLQRPHPDTLFALALIHHLVIASGIPLGKVASLFASLCQNLIIEFVPKRDSQVQKLLSSREDVFGEYDENYFEKVFSSFFSIIAKERIRNSERVLYLMKKKENHV